MKIQSRFAAVVAGLLYGGQKEWQMEGQSAKDFSKAIQKGSSTQPQGLGGGG